MKDDDEFGKAIRELKNCVIKELRLRELTEWLNDILLRREQISVGKSAEKIMKRNHLLKSDLLKSLAKKEWFRAVQTNPTHMIVKIDRYTGLRFEVIRLNPDDYDHFNYRWILAECHKYGFKVVLL